MHHPYQCLAICRPQSPGPQYLLAASGHKLFSVDLRDGSIVGRWPREDANGVEIPSQEQPEAEGPPSKRQRLSENVSDEALPSITLVTTASNGKHAVLVTAEDKCIRVIEISPEGNITQLSARCMPKKPFSIALTANDEEILSADKFGDVYALPFSPTAEQEAEFVAAQQLAADAKTYAPAATELTVHSKANRRALETQLQRAKEKLTSKAKEPLAFTHKLILGHVSMLTDLLIVNAQRGEGFTSPRTYILTADRDEHIRISRGPSQAHVIEGFCLGHHEFVSKLCLAQPDLLVSGGGDDDLFIWNWQTQKLLNKVNISEALPKAFMHIHARPESLDEEGDTDVIAEAPMETKEDITVAPRVAVSGIWKFSVSAFGRKPHLLFTCESVPAVFHFPISALGDERGGQDIGFLPLVGNPLDVAFYGNTVFVSIDVIHKAGSTTEVDSSEEYKPRIQAFELVGEDLDGAAVWKTHESLSHILVDLNQTSTVEWHEKTLQALLYGTENLRKRAETEEVVD